MSAFDPKLLEATEITEANATKMDPVPEGVYTAFLDDYEFRTAKTKDGERAILRVQWMIPDEGLKKQLSRDTVRIRQDIWLDLTPQGGIATGPNVNVALGRLREATGLNSGKKPFRFPALKGQGPVTITIAHDKNDDTGDVYDKVVMTRKPE